jgi:hypothetical protein
VYFLKALAISIIKWMKSKKVKPRVRLEAVQKINKRLGEASSTVTLDMYAAATHNGMQKMTK